MTDALTFLKNRRSRPAKIMTSPVPGKEALEALLVMAARTPDHGKLEPWRFVVLEQAALRRLGVLARSMAEAAGTDVVDAAKASHQFETGILAVVVVESPKECLKFPEIEQTYSAGAVCLSLLNAALASGWGANWLSGWASHQPKFCMLGLQLEPHERVAGIIHIGTGPSIMPDRPRPDVAALTQWKKT
ncbi:MAG: nitroreductase [Planktomarina sp.]|jgi:nitroreductase|tara:strand:+ start:169 stop:735 length:567 start_codon:yes stop_codon:yes gene_type:complete